jgi:hypothetical protein
VGLFPGKANRGQELSGAREETFDIFSGSCSFRLVGR